MSVSIKLYGDHGYSAAKVFENDGICVCLGGGNTIDHRQAIIIIEIPDLGLSIVGGQELHRAIIKGRKISEVCWSREAATIKRKALRALCEYWADHPHDFINTMYELARENRRIGQDDAQKEARNKLSGFLESIGARAARAA